ncbi:bicyclomycin resistance protein [Roseateles sp. DAIF2]|uniref:ABC transporter substrate-binding protein n=1 Tax=Roseateles sp. DAIF2 TaxID=2714952 RepID=UPI0018A28340|nr:ABC transporter substrate-binding protein [Roseateles sp. DAIF2]QPF76133.1 bicyclomycin resistance protein [Roseateles sp. DAIF2]
MKRRTLLAGAALLPTAPGAQPLSSSARPKTLRLAYNSAEVGFDPPQVSDQTSVAVNAHIFEAPLTYDYLARPARLIPQTCAALPEVGDEHRRFVFTLRPGIFFADDPAFGGKPRELVAADYVYTLKRFFDPRIKTEHLHHFENAQILGMQALRERAIRAKRGLDYDAAVEGLRALDRYRFEIRVAQSAPRLTQLFADAGLTGAIAREVVEAYGGDIMAHPVGTGPFRLARWRRGSQILLERNPRFREQFFAAEPPADDAEGQALVQRLAGRRLPLVDRVEVNVIIEEQPRWLAFATGELDVVEMPTGVAPLVLPGGRLAPHLAKRGIQARSSLGPDTRLTFFNFDDAQVGGYTPEKVALRRAIALGLDNEAELRLVFKGQGLPAQSLLPAAVYGHDPVLKSEMGSADLPRARALLDLYGYRDVDGDGYLENPDGSRLTLRLAGVEDQRQRALNELWRKRMDLLGLRLEFDIGTFGELIKKTLAGQLMMWSYSWNISFPDGDFFLGMAYGPNAGQSNDARFKLPAYDRLYETQRALPDGPERLALMRRANRMMLAYMPYLAHWHALRTDLCQPGVSGYRRHPFTRDWWRFVDLA